jgi:Flp pilus assembly pilin Flp
MGPARRRPRFFLRSIGAERIGPTDREHIMQSSVAVAMLRKIAQLRRSEHGQDLLEYAMLAGLIAIFALGAVSSVGHSIHTVFWQTIASANF